MACTTGVKNLCKDTCAQQLVLNRFPQASTSTTTWSTAPTGWNAATPDQQKEYMHLFQELVIKTYGDRMTLYSGEGFQVVAVRPETEKDTIVNSQITHPDGSQPTTIDWRVRLRDGKLGVIDVVVEGVSLSVTQRQEYSAVIQNNGGQISALLDKMRQELKAADQKDKG